ncbi:MAG: deoxyribodipyrimidine photo-lyase [Acidobacteria bacterium]|nr:deoxyribodipyrimidine photo-lyase [Acidobacteriota bacterium]
MDSSASIVWFRQDLRLDDNPALTAAARQGPVIPVFLYPGEEENSWAPGPTSQWWLNKSLHCLDDELRRLGSRLVICRGPALSALMEICSSLGVRRIFCNRRYEPLAADQDQQTKRSLADAGIGLEFFNSTLLFDPDAVLNQAGEPYKVFTSYWNRCLQLPQSAETSAEPAVLQSPRRWPESIALTDFTPQLEQAWADGLDHCWQPGEANTHKMLEQFLHRSIESYITNRDLPGLAGTSRLSPHLHFGEISPRRIWNAVRQVTQSPAQRDTGLLQSAEALLRQLIWREFAYYILHHFPLSAEQPSHHEFRKFPWRKDERSLRAWQNGLTGYPMVDAGMRELLYTGWMHNRVRMIVASFLTKHLLISWQTGARWFWERLVDADLANNTFGWQWAAGCGHDAAPYFRIFNPVIQGQKFDPQGTYVRRWIPELAGVPDKWIHQPWVVPGTVLESAGVKLGRDYPRPIVDHTEARARALSALAFVQEMRASRQVKKKNA